MTTGFHTYGVDWEPDTITWYFDGQKVFQTATPIDLNKPMYMIADLAVGGYCPGARMRRRSSRPRCGSTTFGLTRPTRGRHGHVGRLGRDR